MQKKRLERANLLPYFFDLFISSEIGYEKPDKRFFDTCLKRSNLASKDILFIGDNFEVDMKGASTSGLATCWYNPNKLSKNDDCHITYMISHLSELKKIL